MQQLNQYHQEGNNYEAVKAKRVVTNLFYDDLSTTLNGRYFFNEYPDLNEKTIVGIKFNTNTAGFDNTEDFFQIGLGAGTGYLDNNIGQQVLYADRATGRYLYLNLYNNENELILQNFPLNLLNPPLLSTTTLGGKITAFNSKLNLKNSYIFCTYPVALPALVAVSLTFYYLDK